MQGDEWVASDYDGRGRRVRIKSSKGADITIGRNAVGDVTHLAEGRKSADAAGFEAGFKRDGLGLELERTLLAA